VKTRHYDLGLSFDPGAAAVVAAAHRNAPRTGDAEAHAAYASLIGESDRLFRLITSGRRPVQIGFTRCSSPYADAEELIMSTNRERVLEITAVATERDRLHPFMDCSIGGAYDRFRAVHDVLGHGWLEVGFDRVGEYVAWRYQERFHSPLARRALATELHGEHSVRWTTGEPAEHKTALLDERLVARSRRGRSKACATAR
jgi:hypothetical protein